MLNGSPVIVCIRGANSDPNKFKGVYRLRLPIAGEVLPGVLAPPETPAPE